MQSYSHPDVFFCPLYNPPGVSDPISAILSGQSEHWTPNPYSTPPTSRAGSPSAESTLVSSNSSPASSRDSTQSPPSSPSSSSSSSSSGGSTKLQKYRRMCAKSGKPFLDFVAEVENRRLVHRKRSHVSHPGPRAPFHADFAVGLQLKSSQSPRNPPARPGSARC
ncbi:hypothetical protein BD413DRAFT_484871 [Trametes elegans]|nr:hypothetical protein BD413DRAFT_484871 [Trametes elegans]